MTAVTFLSRSNRLTRVANGYSTYSSATAGCQSLTYLRPDTCRCQTVKDAGSLTTAKSLTTSNCGANWKLAGIHSGLELTQRSSCMFTPNMARADSIA